MAGVGFGSGRRLLAEMARVTAPMIKEVEEHFG